MFLLMVKKNMIRGGGDSGVIKGGDKNINILIQPTSPSVVTPAFKNLD